MGAAQTITVALVGDTKRLESSLSTGQKIVSVAGAAMTAALVAFGKASVDAYEQAQQSQDKLSFALSKSPTLYNANADALAQFNKELAAKVAIDDDALAGAEATLVKYAKTRGELEQLIQLTVDYSRATGKDLASSALLVGKATDGQTTALRALGITYVKTGNVAKDAANIQQLLNDQVQGFAEQYADSAAGKAEELNRQYTDLEQSIGAGLAPIQMKFNTILADGLSVVNDWNPAVKNTIFGLGLMGSTAMTVIPQIIALRANMKTADLSFKSMGASAKNAALAMRSFLASSGLVGIAFAVAGAALISLIGSTNEAAEATSEYTDTLDSNTGAITGNTKAAVARRLESSGILQAIQAEGESVTGLTNAVVKGGGALNHWILTHRDAATAVVATGNKFTGGSQTVAQALMGESDAIDRSRESWQRQDSAASSAADTTKKTGYAANYTADRVQNLADKVQGLIDKFTILNQGYLDKREAVSNYQEAIDAASQAARQNANTLDLGTKAGRENDAALRQVATTADDLAQNLVATGHSQKQLNDLYHETHVQLVQQAMDMGKTKGAAKDYADQILKTPKEWKTDFKVIAAQSDLLAWQHHIDQVPKTASTTWSFTTDTSADQVAIRLASSGKGQAMMTAGLFAGGGRIRGRGGPTDDANLALVSNDEFIVNAQSSRKLGYGFLDRLNRFATGGRVAEDGSTVGRGFYGNGGGNGMTPEEQRQAEQDRRQQQKDDWRALMDHLNELVHTAKDNLQEIKGQRRDFANNIQGSLMSQLTLKDTQADNRDNDARSRLQRYRRSAQKIMHFMGQLNRLRRLGLPAALSNEIFDLGSDEGSIVARQLIADPKTIQGYENVYRRLNRATGNYADHAAGRRFGDDMRHARNQLDRAEREQRRAQQAHQSGLTIHELLVHLDANTTPRDRRAARRAAHDLMEAIEGINRKNGHANRKNGRKHQGSN